jgi:hypothetical protein
LITLGTFDLSSIDQFQVSASRLGSGGTSYAWVLQANGTIIAAGGENDPIRVANLALFKSGNVTLTLRQSTSSGEASDSSVTGWTVNNVKFYRTTPVNVFVSLDSPEATSFIRTDPMMSKLSPAERQKKLREMLEAGDEYVEKMLGSGFPGAGSVPPGDYDPFKQAPAGKAGDTPGVEVSDFDVSKMEKDYGEVAGYDPMYANIKSGQVPYMKPDKARQLLSNPKYQKLWNDDPDALKIVQRLAGA